MSSSTVGKTSTWDAYLAAQSAKKEAATRGTGVAVEPSPDAATLQSESVRDVVSVDPRTRKLGNMIYPAIQYDLGCGLWSAVPGLGALALLDLGDSKYSCMGRPARINQVGAVINVAGTVAVGAGVLLASAPLAAYGAASLVVCAGIGFLTA